ncbi:hypothetical protein ACXYMO_04880 [Arenibacterium sp. CAU 1754]
MAENNRDLDSLFQAARRDAAEMPAGLSNRILADAARVQAQSRAPRPPRARQTWFAQLREALGGWYGMGGLAAACATGLWMGIAPPDIMPDPVQMVFGTQADLDLLSADDLSSVLAQVEEG